VGEVQLEKNVKKRVEAYLLGAHLNCGLEAHRDAVGVLNIGYRRGGSINGVMAYPLLLRWNGMRWEPKRAMNNQPMNTLEARIPQASAVGVSIGYCHGICDGIKIVVEAFPVMYRIIEERAEKVKEDLGELGQDY